MTSCVTERVLDEMREHVRGACVGRGDRAVAVTLDRARGSLEVEDVSPWRRREAGLSPLRNARWRLRMCELFERYCEAHPAGRGSAPTRWHAGFVVTADGEVYAVTTPDREDDDARG